jgi:hypothetical protein
VTKVGLSVGGEGRGSGMMASNQRRSKREEMDQMLNKAALGFRLSQFVFCLASFAVMAADKTQRWSGERKHPRISVSPSLSRPKSLLSLSALSLRFSENKKKKRRSRGEEKKGKRN